MSKKVVIIGAGFAGLSAGALLAKSGFDVTILEKNKQPGGRTSVLKKDGFVFDLGPSWYMMPDVFETFFTELGEDINDYYKLIKLDPSYRLFFDQDNSIVDLPSDTQETVKLFESIEKGAGEKLKQYLKKVKFKYELGINKFIRKPYLKWSDLITKDTIRYGLAMDLHRSYAQVVRSSFKNQKLHQILEYPSVFLGGSPKNIWALFNVISHADFGLKIWYPMGGFGEVSKALEKVCLKNGVKIKYGEPVIKLEVENKKVVQAKTAQNTYSADIFCGCADYHYIETNLLDSEYQSIPEEQWEQKTMSPSCLLIYLGVNKKIDNLKHHNYFFNAEWDKHIDSIYTKHEWPQNPQFYVSCPSKTDPSVAPEGKENLFILMPIAPGIEDHAPIREKYFEKIIEKIEIKTGTKFKSDIIYKKIWGVNNLKNEYNSYKGNAFGLALTLDQSLIFRPKMKSSKLDNLYYGGHYTNPGTGTPLAILSGQILKDLITTGV